MCYGGIFTFLNFVNFDKTLLKSEGAEINSSITRNSSQIVRPNFHKHN